MYKKDISGKELEELKIENESKNGNQFKQKQNESANKPINKHYSTSNLF